MALGILVRGPCCCIDYCGWNKSWTKCPIREAGRNGRHEMPYPIMVLWREPVIFMGMKDSGKGPTLGSYGDSWGPYGFYGWRMGHACYI